MVAVERRACLREQIALVLAVAEARTAPAGIEQLVHLRERLRAAVRMEALEHLVDDDAEALVHRLLGRDAQDARELVAQRTAAVRLDVRRRQRQPDALARQERIERVLVATAHLRPLGERLVERRRLEDLTLHWRRRGEQSRVDVRERLLELLSDRALQERRELDQLEVANDAVRDVQFGIQAQLAEMPADPRDAVEHLLAQELEGRLEVRVRRCGPILASLETLCSDRRLRVRARAASGPRGRHDRREMARELARCRGRIAADELDCQVAQALQARVALGCLACAQQRPPARSEQLDQLGDEDVRRKPVEPAGGAAVDGDEALDPFARLRWDLRRLGCRRQSGDEVELAPARNLDHARKMRLAKLDRRSCERTHDRGGVLWVNEQTHPREHVSDLRTPQERDTLALAVRAGGCGSGRDSGGGHHPRIRALPPERRGETYGAQRLPGYALLVDSIDWRAAQKIGERIAGSPTSGGVRAAAIEPRAYDFARRVSEYSGLGVPSALPPLEAVDRSTWIAANLRTMRPLLGGLSERIGDGTGPLAGPLRAASGFLLGAQVGALTGVLSQRVLGQYDLALLDDTVAPRLLLLAPNLSIAARNLSVGRDELVLWVTIHEITHAVQFTGAPWLRKHIGGMLEELIDGLQVTLAGKSKSDGDSEPSGAGGSGNGGGWADRLSMPKLPDPAELREMAERARRGELLRLTLGEDRWLLVERMQAAMSLIEGHAEHTMDAIGADVLPSLPKLRAAMNRRRESRGLPWRVLEKLLGLEMKMRQYEVGRRFCDAVVADGGPRPSARVWHGARAAAEHRGVGRSSGLADAHRRNQRLCGLGRARAALEARAQAPRHAWLPFPRRAKSMQPRRTHVLRRRLEMRPKPPQTQCTRGRTHVPPVTSSRSINT